MGDNSSIEEPKATWQTITAAKRIGLPVEDYVANLKAGLKWCTSCKQWHQRSIFTVDKSRGDGLTASCRGRATRAPKTLLTKEEKRLRARESYRRYYAGKGGAAIRASKTARRRGTTPIPPWWREEQLELGCAYCEAPADTMDHVVPISLGGPTRPENMAPACRSCNSTKKNSNPLPWINKMRPEIFERLTTRPMNGTNVFDILEWVAHAN